MYLKEGTYHTRLFRGPASDLYTSLSHTGYVIMMNGGPISWKSVKQETVSLSTAEIEWYGPYTPPLPSPSTHLSTHTSHGPYTPTPLNLSLCPPIHPYLHNRPKPSSAGVAEKKRVCVLMLNCENCLKEA